jgi:hypothetical protein
MFHLNIVDILPVLIWVTPNDDGSVLDVLTVFFFSYIQERKIETLIHFSSHISRKEKLKPLFIFLLIYPGRVVNVFKKNIP